MIGFIAGMGFCALVVAASFFWLYVLACSFKQ